MTPFSPEHVGRIAIRAHALAEPTRVRILNALRNGELAVNRIAELLHQAQSTTSKHLQVLHRAGLVSRRRDASAVIYSLSSKAVLRCCRYLGLSRLERFPPK